LECVSCHQRDSGDVAVTPEQLAGVPLSAALPARSRGAAMLPLVYEKHCQACHPLTLERKANAEFVTIPHRLQPQQLHEYLDGYYTRLALAGQSKPFERFVAPRPLPGDVLKEQGELLRSIRDKVATAEKQLFLGKQTCGECHYYAPDEKAIVPKKIEPTQIPAVWFEHANFNHTAHRLLECRACHAGAYAFDEKGSPNPYASADSKDVLLPGIGTCLECHAPRAQGGTARHGCVECHRYHDGDHPLHGRGSASRAGPSAGRRTVREFLEGKAP
jgi:hypothetical protein